MRASRFWAFSKRVGVADGVLRREALELGEQDGALPLGHAEVRADAGVVVEPAPALAPAVRIVPGRLEQRLVVADQRAALTGGHELALLHREAAERAVAADAAPAPLRAVRVRAILDQVQPAPLAERDEQIEVADGAGHVDGDDRPGARRDRGLGRRRVDA
jgi:hypothetical protein